MLYVRREQYVSQEEYLKMLGALNLAEALRVIVDKPFVAHVLKKLEKERITLQDALRELDRHHAEVLHNIVESSEYRERAYVVEGVTEAYNTTIALLNYSKGFKPISYIPSLSVFFLEEYFAGKLSSYVNPYVHELLKRYRARKKLEASDVIRTYDLIRENIRRFHYSDFVIAGSLYDLTLLRLCGISELREASWRPLLIDTGDLVMACRLAETDPLSAIDVLKKTRPLMSMVASIALDASKVTSGGELLDFLISTTPAHLSTAMLYTRGFSVYLKNYLLILRQSTLLRLVITSMYSEDVTLKSVVKTFIEKWVKP